MARRKTKKKEKVNFVWNKHLIYIIVLLSTMFIASVSIPKKSSTQKTYSLYKNSYDSVNRFYKDIPIKYTSLRQIKSMIKSKKTFIVIYDTNLEQNGIMPRAIKFNTSHKLDNLYYLDSTKVFNKKKDLKESTKEKFYKKLEKDSGKIGNVDLFSTTNIFVYKNGEYNKEYSINFENDNDAAINQAINNLYKYEDMVDENASRS